MTLLPRRSFAPVLAALLLTFVWTGCDSGDPEEPTGDLRLVTGVSMKRLFDPATSAEIASVRAEWAARTPEAQNATVVSSISFDGATLHLVSHSIVGGPGAGETHYGIVRVPDGIEDDAPVLVIHHGGDDGFSIASGNGYVTSNTSVEAMVDVFPALMQSTVQVIPTYRSEPLLAGVGGLDAQYVSGGSQSPWDYDVDDSIAFLSSALQLFGDETDEDAIGALGFSRGSNTALLHQIRDSRIDAVTEYYGPTDFYNESSEGLATGLLIGLAGLNNLPGAQYLLDEVLSPLRSGSGSYDASADYDTARLEVVRRSASLFKSDLQNLQIHHHTADPVVPYPFSVGFDTREGSVGGDFEFNTYSDAVPANTSAHSPEGIPTSQVATEAWLSAYLGITFQTVTEARTPVLAY